MKQSTQTQQLDITQAAQLTHQLGQDVKHAVLIVSLVLNLTVFTTWLVVVLS